MPRKHRSFARPLTRDAESAVLRYVYGDEDFQGYMQPEVEEVKEGEDAPLLYWVGRLWRNDADPHTSDPLILHRSDNPWDCGDSLMGLADELRNTDDEEDA